MPGLRRTAALPGAARGSTGVPRTPGREGPAVGEMLLRAYREALRGSSYGRLDDGLALLGGWGFDPAAVTRPVPPERTTS
ncbi:hypothetical protein [Streptomyces canus]|uniref:hypothetical protein n=1 Tax=Streptomyces canus TaxID=58343 RepID=UPI00286F039B|nr:hypothetical protein [Streptomyces canus]